MDEPIAISRISAEEIYRVSRTYEEIQKVEADDSPFMIIKPFGMEHLCDIIDFIREQGIGILKKTTIHDWKKLALFLYLGNHGEAIELNIARNKMHSKVEKGNTAVHLLLQATPTELVTKVKEELRKRYGGNGTMQMLYGGKVYTPKLDCIHSPDPERQDIESRVIRHYFLT